MKPASVLILYGVLFLSSCSDTPKVDVKEPEPVAVLSESDIFSGDIVKRFSAANPADQKEANGLFLQAVNIYRNEKDPYKAVEFFVKSICRNPESQTYYEMGNALSDAGNLNQAILSYEMAEKLGYEPFSKVLYNIACIYSRQDNTDKAGEYLEASLQAGYSNLRQIEKDKDLENLRKTYTYRYAISNGTKGMSNPEQLFWLQFRRDFAAVKPDFSIDGEKRQYTKDNPVSFDYEGYISEMRTEKFSREVGRLFYPVAEIPLEGKFAGLVYAEEDAYEENPWIIYRLAIFNKEGKLLDKLIIAGIENPDKLLTAKFGKGGTFTLKEFEIRYKKDPLKDGFENNKIVSRKLSGEKSYMISPTGTIVEITTGNLVSEAADK